MTRFLEGVKAPGVTPVMFLAVWFAVPAAAAISPQYEESYGSVYVDLLVGDCDEIVDEWQRLSPSVCLDEVTHPCSDGSAGGRVCFYADPSGRSIRLQVGAGAGILGAPEPPHRVDADVDVVLPLTVDVTGMYTVNYEWDRDRDFYCTGDFSRLSCSLDTSLWSTGGPAEVFLEVGTVYQLRAEARVCIDCSDGGSGQAWFIWEMSTGTSEIPVTEPGSADSEPSAGAGFEFANPYHAGAPILLRSPGATSPGIVQVLDARGRLLRELSGAAIAARPLEFSWDGRSERTDLLPEGVYWLHAVSGAERWTRKIVLVH